MVIVTLGYVGWNRLNHELDLIIFVFNLIG